MNSSACLYISRSSKLHQSPISFNTICKKGIQKKINKTRFKINNHRKIEINKFYGSSRLDELNVIHLENNHIRRLAKQKVI